MKNIAIEPHFLPYGRQNIDDDDIAGVVNVLKSDRLTQGPTIEAFEKVFAQRVNAKHVIACTNGTAALHLTMLAQGITCDDDVVVTTPITFVASANCARFVGATVKFVDVEPETALMSPDRLCEIIERDTEHTIKAVIPVHFAGQPVNLQIIGDICRERNIAVIDDCCHAVGGSFNVDRDMHILGGNTYSLMSAFSFHPVKHIATGEGGAVSTNDDQVAAALRRLRSHGITQDSFIHKDMAYAPDGSINPWYHEMQVLSPNYRLNDIQAALGITQLDKLDDSLKRRNTIALRYHNLIADAFDPDEVKPLVCKTDVFHAYHLYVLQINFRRLNIERSEVMNRLRANHIGTQVHYIPVHLQPYYRHHSGTKPGDYPNAEAYYDQALSIPMYPQLTDEDCHRVIDSLKHILFSHSIQ